MDLSVIIATFRQQQFLPAQMEALSRQDFDGRYEIIVCDDGTPVPDVAALSVSLRALPKSFRYVWQPDAGYRLSRSRNNGIRCAVGDVLLFLDGDMIPTTDCLSRHMSAHRQADGHTIVPGFSQTVEIPAGVAPSLGDIVSLAETLPSTAGSERQWKLLNSALPWTGCWGGHCSVTRAPEVIYDEAIEGFGHEDAELFCRLCHRHNFHLWTNDRICTLHLRLPPSSSPWNPWGIGRQDAIEFQVRNCLYLLDKFPEIDLSEAVWPLRHFRVGEDGVTWCRAEPQATLALADAIRQARQWAARIASGR